MRIELLLQILDTLIFILTVFFFPDPALTEISSFNFMQEDILILCQLFSLSRSCLNRNIVQCSAGRSSNLSTSYHIGPTLIIIMNNTTDSGSNHTIRVMPRDFQIAMQAIFMSHAVYMVLGTLINVWLLSCILTSKELRERFRNQLICNMVILHLTESLIKSPVIIAFALALLKGDPVIRPCFHIATISNTERIQSFIVDWLLVFLVIIFLAQVLNLNPTNKLTPLSARVGKVIIHLLPWIAALSVTPTIVYFYRGRSSCLSPPYLSHYVFAAINTVAPITLAIFFTTFASTISCLKRRSRTKNIGAHLIDGVRDVDNSFAYIAAVTTSAVCELCNVAFYMDVKINHRHMG